MSDLQSVEADLPTFLNLVDLDDEHFLLTAHEKAEPRFLELRRKSDLEAIFRVELDEKAVRGGAAVGEHVLVATRKKLRAWNRSGKEVARFETPNFFEALSPLDDDRVVACIGNVPHTLDVATFLDGQAEWTRHEHKSGPLHSVSSSPDARYYATGEQEMTRIYDVGKGKQVRCIRKAGAPTLFMDGQFVTGGHRDLYFHETGKKWNQIAQIPIPNRLRALTVTPDGSRLAVGTSGYKAASHLMSFDLSGNLPQLAERLQLSSDPDAGLLYLDDKRLLVAQTNELCVHAG